MTDDTGPEQKHEFGGAWTLLKLEVLKKYLAAYTTALKHKRYRLIYVDGFAGTGSVNVWTGLAEEDDRYDGSAKIAIATNPPFANLIFIEKKLGRVRELEQLAGRHMDRTIEIRRGDANAELAAICAAYQWRHARAVLFLDPYGMSVQWETLQTIASTEAIDVWYLFPLSGVVRQAARDLRGIDDSKIASLTRTLGTAEWRTAWYRPKRQQSLFAEVIEEERHFDHEQITGWVTERLEKVFPGVVGPRVLRGYQDAPLFALYFLISNPSPTAQRLAKRIALNILDSV